MTNKTPFERTPGVQAAGGIESTNKNDPRTARQREQEQGQQKRSPSDRDRAGGAPPARDEHRMNSPTQTQSNGNEVDEFTGEALEDEAMLDATEQPNKGEPHGRTNGRSPQRGNAGEPSSSQSATKKKMDDPNCGCDPNEETR